MKLFSSLALFAVSAPLFAAPDIVLEDFESGSYAPKWSVEGGAFGEAPARGAFPNQQRVSGYGGDFLVNSYFNGDGSTGKITSRPFKIGRGFLELLVGGGRDMGRLYARVLVDGVEAGRVTGGNDEALSLRTIDLRGHAGREAVIEIADKATGGWGHINVDDIILTDNPRGIVETRTVAVPDAGRYLEIPVNNAAPFRRIRVLDASSSEVVSDFRARVDFENPQWVMSLDTGASGRSLEVECGAKMGETPRFESSDSYRANSYPDELLRPQYHFSAPQGWLNDPNGLVYWNGKWRMYYQLTPDGLDSGVKHWGLAVSNDLIAWEHKPVAIRAHYLKGGGDNAIWSGTAFADTHNAGGLFGPGGGLVFAYTLTGRGDFVAHSPDGYGIKTFETPITTAPGRDPCIFFHKPSGKWVVLRYEIVKSDERADGGRKFVFYTSKDLKNWERGQVLDDFYECPYIVPVPLEGGGEKYLIFDARGECVVGDFDGEKFTPASGRLPRFLVGDAYAGQVWNNAPGGRVVAVSWLRQPVADFEKSGMPFSQAMTLPMELGLERKGGGYRVKVRPIFDIRKYFYKGKAVRNLGLSAADEPLGFEAGPMAVEAVFDISKSERAGLKIGEVRITFDKSKNAYEIRGEGAESAGPPVRPRGRGGNFEMPHKAGDELRFWVFADRSSLEIFHGDGDRAVAIYMPFGDGKSAVSAFGEGAVLKKISMHNVMPAFSPSSLKGLDAGGQKKAPRVSAGPR